MDVAAQGHDHRVGTASTPGKGTWQVRARTLKGRPKSGWSPVVTLS